MVLYVDDVIYHDPTDESDVLSAEPRHPADTANFDRYGIISITHSTDFAGGVHDNHGHSQSVCIKPGDELELLGRLGNKLLGLDGGNKTIVTTTAELKRLLKLVISKYSDDGPEVFALRDLVDLLTGADNYLYSPAERSGDSVSS